MRSFREFYALINKKFIRSLIMLDVLLMEAMHMYHRMSLNGPEKIQQRRKNGNGQNGYYHVDINEHVSHTLG